jgi:TolB-like protein
VRAQRFIKTIPKRGYKLLVVPGAFEEGAKPGMLQTAIARLAVQFRYADYRTLGIGLLVMVSMLTLAVFSSRLERTPRAKGTLVLAQYPFQLQAAENDTISLFAQGLYSNLITRLTEVESLQVIPVDSHGADEGQPATGVALSVDRSDYQVRGAIVQADQSASLYLNLVRSSSGIVEYSRRLNVKPSALPEDLDPLTDKLVELITSQLLSPLADGAATVRSRF